MKFFVTFLLMAAALGMASAGFIGGGWSPSYSRVVYSPSYSGWNGGYGGYNRGYGGWNRGYGGWNRGYGGYGGYGSGWNRGWSGGYGSGWW